MSTKPKVFFVGGFLGAGKTTAIHSLAQLFARKGLKTSAITNDQAMGLVDTRFLVDSGIPSEEVAGSCFCCNFNGLAEAVKHSIATAAPDVILAEPVGSCTDIVATVIRPMRALMQDKVDVFPYSVLVEPGRWAELTAADAAWSMKYLFDKQLKEADFVVVTKLDTLETDRARALLAEVSAACPESGMVGISSKDGTGMEEWLQLVRGTAPGERWLQEIDYTTYAEAEAEMGWLNGSISLTFPEAVDGKTMSAALVGKMAQGIGQRRGRIGHLKLLVVSSAGSAKIGITQVGEYPTMEGTFTAPANGFQVTVNVRATLSPGDLSAIVHETVGYFSQEEKATADIAAINTFRPGAPNPTYRYQ